MLQKPSLQCSILLSPISYFSFLCPIPTFSTYSISYSNFQYLPTFKARPWSDLRWCVMSRACCDPSRLHKYFSECNPVSVSFHFLAGGCSWIMSESFSGIGLSESFNTLIIVYYPDWHHLKTIERWKMSFIVHGLALIVWQQFWAQYWSWSPQEDLQWRPSDTGPGCPRIWIPLRDYPPPSRLTMLQGDS